MVLDISVIILDFVQDIFIFIKDTFLNIFSAILPDGMGHVLSDLVMVFFPDLIGHGDVMFSLSIFPDCQALDYEFIVEDDVGPGFGFGCGAPVQFDLNFGDVHGFLFLLMSLFRSFCCLIFVRMSAAVNRWT
jgi:hypothetical protein